MFLYFLRLLAARQALENFQLIDPNPAFNCDNSACRFFQLDIGLKFLNFVITYRHRFNRTIEVGCNPGAVQGQLPE